MKIFIIKIISLFFLFSHLAYASPAKIIDFNILSSSDKTTVEIFLTKPICYRYFTLAKPQRLVLDFEQAKVRYKPEKWSSSLIKNIRLGYPKKHQLRIVFDLTHPVEFKLVEQNNRIILNFRKKKLKPFIIVIDPGHGGKDPGTVGTFGMKEKNIVLNVSRRLTELINREPTIHAVLTRDGDFFVPLIKRLKTARKNKADLFISIHADSFFDKKCNGSSVFALSDKGATSVAAKWLAQRENHSELGGLDFKELADQSPQLRFLLIDLAQTATIKNSLALGNSLLQALDDITKLHHRRVEQAPFMVLKSPDIPSVLIEIGFLSNPKEEMKLQNVLYQQQMAQAIFDGIKMYLKV